MDVELRQLRYFVAVAEEGQFTRAARRLHLAQPALSQAIQQLERRLGAELLRRHAKGVDLTITGQLVLDTARTTLEALDELADDVSRTDGRNAVRDVGVGFLPPIHQAAGEVVELCRAQHPELEVRWTPLEFDDQVVRLRRGGVDAAFLWVASEMEDVAAVPIATEARAVLLRAAHPLARHETVKVEQVMDLPHPGPYPGIPDDWADIWYLTDVSGRRPPVVSESPNTVEQAWALVASGQAIVVGPAALAAGYAQAGLVARIIADAPPATLALAWRRYDARRSVRWLVATAQRYAGQVNERPGPLPLLPEPSHSRFGGADSDVPTG